MINIKKFIFSPFQENTYVVWDEETKETAIIDPGCLERREEEELSGFIELEKLNVKYLINTHCHIDHIFGNAFVKLKYDCEFYAPEKDLELLNNMKNQADAFGVKVKLSPKPDKLINNEMVLRLGNKKMEFIFTPGHTPGEYSIYLPDEKICFTGDVLFREGIGRTDLWGGDYSTLMNSIKNKLLTLSDETLILPGHGAESTIEYEKKNNPFL